MPLIAETGTERDFPSDAIEVRDEDGELLSVKSAGGWLLWRARDGKAASSAEEHTSQGHDLGYRADGSWWCRTCTKVKREEAVKAAAEGAAATPPKNPDAVLLGRLGGKRGGKARAANLTPEQRHDAAKKAADARWGREQVGEDRPMTQVADTTTVTATPEFPEPIIKAVVMVLGNAQYQTLRAADNQRMDDYFNGFLSGAHTVIGIIAGGLGYSTDFMLEGGEDHDHAIHSGGATVDHSKAD